ncbi:MAG: DUF4249 family protein [Bacteroidetes bacterium]|nr:DUF4249 family protein [Bacteroidota bacterium]
MKRILKLSLIILSIVLISCGDPVIELEEVKYEPKIVVEGYLYPEEPISGIRLMRNFPLEVAIDSSSIVLTPIQNLVTAFINDVPLEFDALTGTYFTNQLAVDYNKAYTLKMNAKISGESLETESTTTTPSKGFKLAQNNLGTIKYFFEKPEVKFSPSPGTGLYIFSIKPDSASLDNFIYSNPFFPNIEKKDIEENFQNFLYQMNLLLNVESTSTEITYEISHLDTWFFSSYTVVVYAGDENFKDYLLTVTHVQEPDGNFIEPKFHFKGNGIGIFGSAIRETLTFNLVP